MCIHVGWVPGISRTLTRLLGFQKIMAEISTAVVECDNPRGLLVEIRCKSGRHRSVCACFSPSHQLKRRGHVVQLVHFQSPDWTTMKCGGTCSACRHYQKCLNAIEGILPPRQDGPIRAPGRPQAKVQAKAMPAPEPRDVRDDHTGGAHGDVELVDTGGASSNAAGDVVSPKNFQEMQKSVNTLADRLAVLTEELKDRHQQQASGVRLACYIRSHIRGGQLAKDTFDNVYDVGVDAENLDSESDEEAEDQEGTFDVAWNPEDLAQADPVEDLISEETLLDDVDVPGLPQDETERRRAWRKLPSVCVLQFVVCIVLLDTCDACERTAPKRPTHKVYQFPLCVTEGCTTEVSFNSTWMNMAYKCIMFHWKVQSPLGVGAVGREQVEQCLNQVLMVKNDSSRVGGFSPAQWVLGKAPRNAASVMSEEQFAELGAIEARHDPSSIFALQHMARIEAQKAYVHLDCSRRVQRALTQNASAFSSRQSKGWYIMVPRFSGDRTRRAKEPLAVMWQCASAGCLAKCQDCKSEALAQAVLSGAPVIPDSIVNAGGQ
eukprot:s3425_g3.t1